MVTTLLDAVGNADQRDLKRGNAKEDNLDAATAGFPAFHAREISGSAHGGLKDKAGAGFREAVEFECGTRLVAHIDGNPGVAFPGGGLPGGQPLPVATDAGSWRASKKVSGRRSATVPVAVENKPSHSGLHIFPAGTFKKTLHKIRWQACGLEHFDDNRDGCATF
jgi:hypothetical protein